MDNRWNNFRSHFIFNLQSIQNHKPEKFLVVHRYFSSLNMIILLSDYQDSFFFYFFLYDPLRTVPPRSDLRAIQKSQMNLKNKNILGFWKRDSIQQQVLNLFLLTEKMIIILEVKLNVQQENYNTIIQQKTHIPFEFDENCVQQHGVILQKDVKKIKVFYISEDLKFEQICDNIESIRKDSKLYLSAVGDIENNYLLSVTEWNQVKFYQIDTQLKKCYLLDSYVESSTTSFGVSTQLLSKPFQNIYFDDFDGEDSSQVHSDSNELLLTENLYQRLIHISNRSNKFNFLQICLNKEEIKQINNQKYCYKPSTQKPKDFQINSPCNNLNCLECADNIYCHFVNKACTVKSVQMKPEFGQFQLMNNDTLSQLSYREYQKYDQCPRPSFCQKISSLKQNNGILLLNTTSSDNFNNLDSNQSKVTKNQFCSWYIEPHYRTDYILLIQIGDFVLTNKFKLDISVCSNIGSNILIPCSNSHVKQQMYNNQRLLYTHIKTKKFRVNLFFPEDMEINKDQFSIEYISMQDYLQNQQIEMYILMFKGLFQILIFIIFIVVITYYCKKRILQFLRVYLRINILREYENLPLDGQSLEFTIRKLKKQKVIYDVKYERVQFQQTECSFCLEPLSDSQLIQAYCGHTFHQTCLTDWIQMETRELKCPICKEKLAKVFIKKNPII